MNSIQNTVGSPINDWFAFLKSFDWRDDRIYLQNTSKAVFEALRLGVSKCKAVSGIGNMIYRAGRPVEWRKLNEVYRSARSQWNDLQNGQGLNQPSTVPAVLTGHGSQKTIREEVIVKSRAHDPVTDIFLIDGQNVMYGSPLSHMPSLLNLLGLLLELQDRKCAFKCYFDANTFHALIRAGRTKEAYAYRGLCRDFPDIFIEVPGGTEADAFLLDYAHSQGSTIISNDRYRDYEGQYSWLNEGPKRRISFLVHSGMMQIVHLSIRATIPKDISVAEAALRSVLGKPLPMKPTNGKAPVPINRHIHEAVVFNAA